MKLTNSSVTIFFILNDTIIKEEKFQKVGLRENEVYHSGTSLKSCLKRAVRISTHFQTVYNYWFSCLKMCFFLFSDV